jgi:hypothetical protein
MEVEDTTGVNRKARQSFVLGAGNKPQYPSSRVGTGLFIAQTAIRPRGEAARGEESAEATGKTAGRTNASNH